MSRTKKIVLPFLVSELLPFDEFLFSHYPYARYNYVAIWNILMKLYSNVYKVKTACRIKKIDRSRFTFGVTSL